MGSNSGGRPPTTDAIIAVAGGRWRAPVGGLPATTGLFAPATARHSCISDYTMPMHRCARNIPMGIPDSLRMSYSSAIPSVIPVIVLHLLLCYLLQSLFHYSFTIYFRPHSALSLHLSAGIKIHNSLQEAKVGFLCSLWD